MPTILAIETSADLASVALLRDGQLISRESAGVQTHSQAVLPLAQAALREAGLTVAGCDVIAFGAGPGSFTGVRTACGVAQGLAFGAGLRIIPVGTLLAMAEACRRQHNACEVLAVLDARMDEVYWAQYRYADGWEVVVEPTLSAASDVRPSGEVTACGNGLAAYAPAFADQKLIVDARPGIVPHAAEVAVLAERDLAAGRALDAWQAQPVYLRNKVALTTAERMARSAA
ncbi:tRNA (adenosine(37)-N6)-threonylcarbamoyltransferase complex dimerization subunit type 1 TsaB [Noviherbaspirillum aridicola]|uniref:tRNA (Adenosine(37)-N6)-threonylcarbamoyltransferase complex dimerization subunit type 1 TsaB n=1 Tax=Noviherbaspirillum aridicola TaxID=2849687 RepID=A0ABQ4Q328_9BURK|nr:tRNA (adenosine(37)-N6)-threonylcarbamoyltransferase complex dimerization subunit type 1 TsaB [Noviherbaspirillum aridicola]GIZ51504.1 tRNA (adenosine(37)-N6)-threonylcarbamoyltransferase complex dimerization subunit type 1 TsaB [Noviherbaspirillum aridicola]